MKKLILFFTFLVALQTNAQNVTLQENLWETEGTVNTSLRSGNTLKIGSDFNYVGPKIGGLVASNTLIYTCGYFTNIGGQNRNNLEALDPIMVNSTVWNSNPNSAVYNHTVNGFLLFEGGVYTTISSQNRGSGKSFNLPESLNG
jgi:hypothetical protein